MKSGASTEASPATVVRSLNAPPIRITGAPSPRRSKAIVVPSAEELAATRKEMMASQEQVAKLSKISPEMVAAIAADLDGAG